MSELLKNNKKRVALYAIIFLAVCIAGFCYVKWYPYLISGTSKVAKAIGTGSIGSPIITLSGDTPISIGAGVSFVISYFNAVWQAVILGLIVGSLVQVLIPRSWIASNLGNSSLASTTKAMLIGLPTMMCTCCTAPVAASLTRSKASINSVVAFFLTNPLLNPATLTFMGFVLGWQFTGLRIVLGIIAVLVIATAVAKFSGKALTEVPGMLETDPASDEGSEHFFARWGKALGRLTLESIPAYVVMVFILGMFQGVIYNVVAGGMTDGILVVLLFALIGTIAVIPTAGEIPIIQVLAAAGVAGGPLCALLFALPACSVVSLGLLKPTMTWKQLGMIFLGVFCTAVVAGIIGMIGSSIF